MEGYLVYGNPIKHIPETARRIGAELDRCRPPAGASRLARWWSDSDEQTLLDLNHCSILDGGPAGDTP